jgi:hypothetical protein
MSGYQTDIEADDRGDTNMSDALDFEEPLD